MAEKPFLFWWQAKSDVGSVAYNAFKHTFDKTGVSRANWEAFWSIYSMKPVDSPIIISPEHPSVNQVETVRIPLTRAVIDTGMSLVAVNKVRPYFVAERDATFQAQERCQAMLSWVDGLYEENNTFALMRAAAAYGFACGSAIIKVGFDKSQSKITHEIVPPWDLVIPPEQLIRGRKVSTVYHTMVADREVLEERFGKSKALKDAILDTEVHSDEIDSFDAITLVEAYRVVPGGKGRKLLVTTAGVIQDEPWKHPVLPFAIWNIGADPGAGKGTGLVPLLAAFQQEVDLLAAKLMRASKGPSNYFLLKESEAPTFRMSNKDWAQVVVKSENPVVATPPPINAGFIQLFQMWWDKGFEVVGINKMAAYGEKPPRLESGQALGYYNEIQAQRLGISELDWQQFSIDVASLSLYFAHRHPSVVARVKGEDYLSKKKFSEVMLPESSYEISVHPTSFLPRTPSGRLETVGSLIDRFPEIHDLGLRMLDIKDDQNLVKYATSKVRSMQAIDSLLASGEYTPPEPYMLPHIGFYLANIHAAYLNAKVEEKPEEILTNYRRWLEEATTMQANAEQAQLAAQIQQMQAAQLAQQPMQAAQPQPPPQGAM